METTYKIISETPGVFAWSFGIANYGVNKRILLGTAFMLQHRMKPWAKGAYGFI